MGVRAHQRQGLRDAEIRIVRREKEVKGRDTRRHLMQKSRTQSWRVGFNNLGSIGGGRSRSVTTDT